MVGGEEEGRHATPAVLVYHTHSLVRGFTTRMCVRNVEALFLRRGFDWGINYLGVGEMHSTASCMKKVKIKASVM